MHGTYDRLDVLINNATQTIRRPAAYYAHLLPAEAAVSNRLGDSSPHGESRLTAAIPTDNPDCSCKLTRVRSS